MVPIIHLYSFSSQLRRFLVIALVAFLFFLIITIPVHAEAPSLSATNIIELTNATRVRWGVQELVRNPVLDYAAQMKADDMVRHGYFSHIGPQSQNSWQWFTAAEYFYTNAAENLAINFNDPAVLQKAWMDSPTHRANIVRSIYTEVGVGIAHGTYQGKPTTFVVQFFAKPAYRYFADSL